MKDDHTQKPGPITISGVHLAEIRIRMLASPAASATVVKVLELQGVATVENLDGLTVLNLLHYPVHFESLSPIHSPLYKPSGFLFPHTSVGSCSYRCTSISAFTASHHMKSPNCSYGGPVRGQ
jgi:hypothetical protein